MNRTLLIRIFLALTLTFMTQQSYACKTAPTAKIVSPDDPHYVCFEGPVTVSFDGKGSGTTGSYDGDNGIPNGGGNGINKYEWHYGDEESGEDYWNDDGETPSHPYEEADEYIVYLQVTDDDDPNQKNDIDETVTIYIMKVEIDEPEPSEFPKYIGVDSSLTLEAKLTPSSATGGTFTWSQVSGPPNAATFSPNGESTTSFSSSTLGSYTIKVEYTIDGVTCDSDSSGTIQVCSAKMFFKAGTPPIETSSLTRTESGTFEVLAPDGNPLTDVTYSNWFFDGEVDRPDFDNTSNTWGGTIVQSGRAYCTVTFGVSFGDIICEVTKDIAALPRSGWSLTPTCVPDTNPNWGDYPTYDVTLGQNQDVGTQSGDVIVPRGMNFGEGYTTAKVSGGPNKDIWYISASTFKSEHETWINKFIKPGTTGYPNPPNENWYEHNASEGIDAAGHLQAVKNHEYYGTGTNRNGHQAFLFDEEAKPGNDVKEEIEDNVCISEDGLWDITGAEVRDIDQDIYDAYVIEPTGNYVGVTYDYDFSNLSWYDVTVNY